MDLTCCTRFFFILNEASQPGTVHLKGRSPSLVCMVLRWPFRAPRVLNAASHVSHTYGRSPECVRMWALRSLDMKKALVHPGSLHLKGRSPVCACRTCLSRSEECLKVWPQL